MKDVIEKVKKIVNGEINISELDDIISKLDTSEIIELSNSIGYPVFTRLCMKKLRHKFVLLQDGAAAIILNKDGDILLQLRKDNNRWGLPGGCQELGERFEETIIREIREETNLFVEEENLKLIGVISGNSRKRTYPNGDVVINNTVLYFVKDFTGSLKIDDESKELKFFNINNLPASLHDKDLINVYKKYLEQHK